MTGVFEAAVASNAVPLITDQISWSEFHRPKRFEDAIGQRQAIERLAAMIRSRSPRNIILSGPSGTGKTTLAEIYAQALFCDAPTQAGSPCCACEQCQIFADGRQVNYYRINCALNSDKAEIEYLLETRMKDSAIFGRQHVALLDEAHQLSPAACDALLLPLERWPKSRIFIFALINPGVFREQFRTRCNELRLEPPTLAEASQYLERLGQHHGLRCEPDAVRLIASYGKGFRYLAQSLESLAVSSSGRAITADHVRRHLLHDRSARLVAYCHALFRSDLAGELQAWEQSALSPEDNVGQLQGLLNFLKRSYIGPTFFKPANDACGLLFSDADCQAMAEGFRQRADALKTDSVTLFDEILEYWANLPLRITETVFENLLIRFHDLITLERKSAVASTRNSADIGGGGPDSRFQSNRMLRHRPAWRDGSHEAATKSATHISARQAAALYEASTFVVQQYGVVFNANIVIDHERLGIRDETRAIALVSSLTRELALRWADWSPAGVINSERGPHRICFHEGREDGSLLSHIILHVPKEFEGNTQRWLKGFFGRLAGCAPYVDAVTVDIQPLINTRGQMARHWDLVRTLWGGLSEEWCMDGQALVDLLQVPPRARRQVGKLAGRRYNLSQSIGEKSQRAAKQAGLPHLSAWNDGAWQAIFDGWELKEHQTRSKLAKARQHEIGQLKEELRASGDPLHQRSLGLIIENKQKMFVADPKVWQRNWVGWWQRDAS